MFGDNPSPCKDCPDRCVGCHSVCQKYLDYSESRQKRKEAQRQENDIVATTWQGLQKARTKELRKHGSLSHRKRFGK